MTYTPNQPVSTDDLKISAPILKNNTNAADNVFGTDHYQFSDATANKGFHKFIHTPQQSGHPTTTATIPQIYAVQDTANLGVLNYSRAWDLNTLPPGPGIPTPLTNINSSANATIINASSSIPILDFAGIPRAFFTGFALDESTGFGTFCTGTYFASANKILFYQNLNPTTFFKFSGTLIGSVLFLTNTSGAPFSQVYWTIILHRLQ